MPLSLYRPLQFCTLLLAAASISPIMKLIAGWLKVVIADLGLLIGIGVLVWLLLSGFGVYWLRLHNYSQVSLMLILAVLLGISLGLLL